MIREDPGISQCLMTCGRTADLPLRYPPIRVRRMHPQILGALPDRIVRVRVPAERPVSLREPSFLVYLPMLMMSLVSALSMTVLALASESFRFVNLILPAGLLFSQLLIIPIRKAAYRKEKERLEEKEEQRKKDETEAETERIRGHLVELEQIGSLCFPGCRDLFVQAEKGIAGYRDARNPAYGKIRFGEATDLCEAELELPQGYDRDSLAAIAGEVRRASRYSLPWIEDLTVYRIICLRRTAMQEPYFCWLLLQMMLYFSALEFLFVYAGAADAMLSRIMAEMPQIRTKEGKRCVIGSSDDAVRVSSWLKQEKRKVLLFRQADSDYGLDDASDLLFVLDTDEEMFQGSCDLDMTFDEFAGTALDLRNGCERLFRADLRQGIRYDLEKLAAEYRIFSPVQEKQTMYHVLEEAGITPAAISENWRKNRAADSIVAVAGTDRSGRHLRDDS